jgi:hypothetical protein
MEDRVFGLAGEEETEQPDQVAADPAGLRPHLDRFPVLATPVSQTPLKTSGNTGMELLKMLGYID